MSMCLRCQRPSPDCYFTVHITNVCVNQDIEWIGCASAGCNVTKRYGIDGDCVKPTLDVSVIETYFALETEKVEIYVNDILVGECKEL